MQCPICGTDLSPLDLVSRTEHVDLCIENGPSIVEINEHNQLVVKKNLPPNKQRKICPICSKTFQSLLTHFKTCAVKNDVPPSLMLEYWETINKESKSNKKFPRELLESFIARSVKDGREGDQVDFARALSLSMADSDPEASSNLSRSRPRVTQEAQPTDQVNNHPEPARNQIGSENAAEILMRNATTADSSGHRINRRNKQFRIELVDDALKISNIELRIDRELAASRSRRYQEALRDSKYSPKNASQDEDCILIEDDEDEASSNQVEAQDLAEPCVTDQTKLFFLSRMKDCDGSESCREARCEGHELTLMLEEHRHYSGSSMDAQTKTKKDLSETTIVPDEPSSSSVAT